MQRVTLTLDDELLTALDALSARRGYHNRSEAVRDILRDALNQDPPSPRCMCISVMTTAWRLRC